MIVGMSVFVYSWLIMRRNWFMLWLIVIIVSFDTLNISIWAIYLLLFSFGMGYFTLLWLSWNFTRFVLDNIIFWSWWDIRFIVKVRYLIWGIVLYFWIGCDLVILITWWFCIGVLIVGGFLVVISYERRWVWDIYQIVMLWIVIY